MALYEITVDCRIANKDYQKWDIVASEEVEYFPSVMAPINWKAPTKAEPIEEVEEVKEEAEEVEEPEEEVKKPAKKRSKKK